MSEPNRGGRPSKLTPELIEAAVGLLLDGNFRKTVAARLGVAYSTFRSWFALGKDYPHGLYGRFRRLVDLAEAEAEASAVRTITEGARDDPWLAAWWLERRFPRRWGRHRAEGTELRKLIRECQRRLDELGRLIADNERIPPGSCGELPPGS